LANNGGLTFADRTFIQQCLGLDWELSYIWR
jgi:hypothetical protein